MSTVRTLGTAVHVLARTVALVGVLAVCAPALAAGGAAPTRRPHIVHLLSDDQGWGDVSYRGSGGAVRTPCLDAWAAEGLRLDRFYAAGCNCSPTRASILSGAFPRRCGVPNVGAAIDPTTITAAHALAGAGYRSVHLGKWHLGGVDAEHPCHPGRLGFTRWVSTAGNQGRMLAPGGYYADGRELPAQSVEDSRFLIDQALAELEQAVADKQPRFIVVWFHCVHVPLAAPPEHLARFAEVADPQQRVRCATLHAMDEQIGRLRAELRRLGLARDTFLSFASDNGPSSPPQSPPTGGLAGSKGKSSEGGQRVPALAEWPARWGQPRTVDATLSTMDLLPTWCAAAGIAVPAGAPTQDGEDVLPILDGARALRQRPINHDQRGSWVVFNAYRLKYSPGGGELTRESGPTTFVRDGDSALRDRLAAQFGEWQRGVDRDAAKAEERKRAAGVAKGAGAEDE